MRERSLGVIIYPDGSQAEIWACKVDAPIWETWTEIVPLKKPRKLSFVFFSLLCLMTFSFSGCVTLQRVGDKPICLLDYNTGIKHCVYDDWKACHDDLQRNSICYHR